MKKLINIVSCLLVIMLFSGCALFRNEAKNWEEGIKGLPMTLQTYDEESNIIDQIKGTSMSIGPDNGFAIIGSEGVREKSSVVNITVGGKGMLHVGSSLIAHESSMINVFEEYGKTVDIENQDRSTPFLNKMVNAMRNITTGNNYLILIRSQTGKPLATFVGDEVTYISTNIDKSTAFLIDGKRLFVYRCDYTVYDLDLLLN